MGVKLTTPLSKIDAFLEKEAKRIENLTVRALKYLGEKCIKEARDRSQVESWFDHTGNLRSSIGYVICMNGSVVYESSFEVIKQGNEGANEGRNLAIRLASEFAGSRWALIVVAGMHYAVTVEAMENKVVLASAELLARRELPKMIEKLERQVAA